MDQPRVRHHVFENGLVLLAEPMAGVLSAAFTLLVPAGVVCEEPEEGGTAAIMAEWIMRGAGDRDSRELLTMLDNLGVTHSEGAQAAHTSLSAATLGRNLMPALDLYADILLRPHLNDSHFEPIRALTLQSLQSLEDDPGSKAIVELRKRHFGDPWGRSSSGTIEGVARASLDSVRTFYESNYRSHGAILAVAGAIDWEPLKQAVARLLGGWKPGRDRTLREQAGGPRFDHLHKDTQQTQVTLAFPTVPFGHPDYYLARATTAILGGFSSARLFTEVREKRGLCYSVQAGYDTYKHTAAVVCHAGTSPQRAQQTLDVTYSELARLAEGGVTADELDTMRAGLKSSLVMQQESTISRSGALAGDWYYLGRVRSIDEIASALDSLNADDVSRFASGLRLGEMTILTLGPDPLKMPT